MVKQWKIPPPEDSLLIQELDPEGLCIVCCKECCAATYATALYAGSAESTFGLLVVYSTVLIKGRLLTLSK
jgi:hypothetical protein